VDVVYLVRPGDANDELRYSLRSLSNLPHDRVWIAGHKPAWVSNVRHLPTVQASSKHHNAFGNLLAALRCDDISAEFVLMNDDFFITSPLPSVPTLHRGPVTDVVAEYRRMFPRGSLYTTAMQATMEWLQAQGIPEPLSYELHTPMVIDRAGMLEVIARAEDDGVDVQRFHYRTAWGNLVGVGGVRVEDCKVYTRHHATIPKPFASTTDATFRDGYVGRMLRGMTVRPGPYEASGKASLHPVS
jgi:hypothetical protein